MQFYDIERMKNVKILNYWNVVSQLSQERKTLKQYPITVMKLFANHHKWWKFNIVIATNFNNYLHKFRTSSK